MCECAEGHETVQYYLLECGIYEQEKQAKEKSRLRKCWNEVFTTRRH